ncbi:hypothetical protein BISA_1274 [Bifidobacterium saguini DSM 23967]|uniref:Polymer-forming cytoskeletal protein n=3 Tax=Bifidobacterium TaxID=1678 RepID=A0A2N5IUE1_9BIFI|nr:MULTISPECIES: polymer-forming cytoskeletal protein [Bifidobacterium]KFI93109.1 hypothetical protein BISA_1274 [Bifidobacterium saguini DSM 23967]PLS25571.1 hypothetical protein Tam1G_0395 [Bifidobacterium imperatoris]QSY57133.1 polymer-forming cytoskeletal protein [Bifidobacterium imperatoris]QTB91269.1 polymer-forming cytoskeletal protein [Bifidobacterium saguini]
MYTEDTGASVVHSGDYDLIDVDQDTIFANGVHFHTTMVEGTLQAKLITGERLIINNGTVRCSGTIRVTSISGCGTLEVKGNLICDSIELIGSLYSEGNIRCSGDLTVTGKLSNIHRINADSVHLNGVVQGNSIYGRTLLMQPLCSTMYSRFGMTNYQERSNVSNIHAQEVDAHKLTCQTLHADTAALRDGSAVQNVICSTTLGLDRTSNVLLLAGNCQRIHLRTA